MQNNITKDIYQERYESHQKRKKEMLASNYGEAKFRRYNRKERVLFFDILENRCSQRIFNKEEITDEELKIMTEAINLSPSSCNRKGIYIKKITERGDKETLGGLMVGGTGWMHRANIILLLIADMKAYKNPDEKHFMPYLDAGVIIQTAYIASEVLNIGCCFVNPNVREKNREFFKKRFDIKEELFCGAIALGKYDKKSK